MACLRTCISYGSTLVYGGDGRMTRSKVALIAVIGSAVCALPLRAQQASEKKATWKSVEFAIVKFNDEAPKSWGMYHTEKKGLLLVRLWKRYLLVDVKEQEAYEIDPQTVKLVGENVEWSLANKPELPIETPEWKTRDVGSMQRTLFRLGKDGHILELQIPLLINGKPAY